MKKYIIYISVLFIGLTACKSDDTPNKHNIKGKKGGVKKEFSNSKHKNKQRAFSKEVIELNKQAILLINERNKKSYQEALTLLNKAILIDTNYYMAYSNKVMVLTKLGEYNKAIEVNKYLITTIKRDYPEAIMNLGLLYDKIGEKHLARKYYNEAINKYSDRIATSEDVLDMVNRAHLGYILDKKEGLEEIDSLIKAYPENKDLIMYKEYLFLEYDHQKALDDL